MSYLDILKRLETDQDGHDFFDFELARKMALGGISDDLLLNLLISVDLEVTPHSLAILRAEANKAVRLYWTSGLAAATDLMDDELRDSLHSLLAPCSDEMFLVAYRLAHFEKFGVAFEY